MGVKCVMGASNEADDIRRAIKLQEQQFAAASWSTFDEYTASRKAVWTLVNVTEGNGFTCNCPVFMKKNICKHSLGLEIHLKIADAPALAKTVPLGQRRKRGRPKQAKPALLRQ